MSGDVVTIDQGTTSTRAIVFDDAFRMAGVRQQEFAQYFPKPGLIEHEPRTSGRPSSPP